MLDGKPNGKGSMIYANGRFKYGDWVTGQFTDKGILAFQCSDKFYSSFIINHGSAKVFYKIAEGTIK